MKRTIYSKPEFNELSKSGFGFHKVEKDNINNSYIVYTLEDEELFVKRLQEEREKECFEIINRGYLWYKTLTEIQLLELKDWYNAWLDCTKTLIKPEKPNWL